MGRTFWTRWLLFGGLVAAWCGPAPASCMEPTQIRALNLMGRSAIADPSPANLGVLREEIAALGDSGGSTGSSTTEAYLSFLSSLGSDTPPGSAELNGRLAEMSRAVQSQAGTGCGADMRAMPGPKRPDVKATEASASGIQSGSGGNPATWSDPVEPKDLAVLGGGMLIIPALLLPAIIMLLRKHKERRNQRLPARYNTGIRFGDKDFPCMVIDVSRGGVCITTPERLPRANAAKIVLPDQTADVVVRWRNEYKMGMSFEKPLSEKAVRAISDL